VSPDHQTVGWIALFENCCTSYPIPVKLVIWANGRLLPLSPYEPIWFWSFQDDGTRVAAREEMLHGESHTRTRQTRKVPRACGLDRFVVRASN
jgi:hypothetical protein